jgi:hypothetical protein
MWGNTARQPETRNILCGKSVVELQKHLFYHARPGLCTEHLQRAAPLKPSLGLAEPAGGFGVVATPDNTPLAGAQVTLTAPDGLAVQESFTYTDGSFTFHNLPPGPYTLAVSLQEFATAFASVTLDPGQSATLTPIALKINPDRAQLSPE